MLFFSPKGDNRVVVIPAEIDRPHSLELEALSVSSRIETELQEVSARLEHSFDFIHTVSNIARFSIDIRMARFVSLSLTLAEWWVEDDTVKHP